MNRLRAAAILSASVAAGCVGTDLPPSVWPPPDFALTVEEFHEAGSSLHVARRFHVGADGEVFYGTSSTPLVDAATGTSLPVFDSLSLYRLEPACLRALARRLDRLGIEELPETAPATGAVGADGVAITWRAFGRRRVLTARGRVRGALAEMLAVIAGHLPPEESFDVRIGRAVLPVLRGVPKPARSIQGALDAQLARIERLGRDDAGVLLQAFALACAAARRDVAEQLLERWQLAVAAHRSGFGIEGDPVLDAALLTRLLPASS